MQSFLTDLLTQMVTDPDAVKVDVVESAGAVNVQINVADEDCGTVVGKSGATIKAIRDILVIYIRKHTPEQVARVFIRVNEDERSQ